MSEETLRQSVIWTNHSLGKIKAIYKENQMSTPKSLSPHKDDFKNGSWRNYSPVELAGWAHLLATRAMNRDDSQTDKIAKDLYDAQNYIDMLVAATQEMDMGRPMPGKLRPIGSVFNETANYNSMEARRTLQAVQQTFAETLQAVPQEAVDKFRQMRRNAMTPKSPSPAN